VLKRTHSARGRGGGGGEGRGAGGPAVEEGGRIGVAAVDLEDDHAVGEGPERLGEVGVADREEPGRAGPFLEPGCERGAVDRAVGREAVELGVRDGVRAVRREQRRHPCTGRRVVHDLVADRPDVGQRLLDERGLDRVLVGEVLVDRRRADPELLAEATHRERVGSVGLVDVPRRLDDLRRPRRVFTRGRRLGYRGRGQGPRPARPGRRRDASTRSPRSRRHSTTRRPRRRRRRPPASSAGGTRAAPAPSRCR
jgi:hypothetical protein